MRRSRLIRRHVDDDDEIGKGVGKKGDAGVSFNRQIYTFIIKVVNK